ncbi:16741_t:CDS:2, partial [Racocetra fulgida]
YFEQTLNNFEQSSNDFEQTSNKIEPTSNDIDSSNKSTLTPILDVPIPTLAPDVPISAVNEHTNGDSKIEMVIDAYLNIHYYTKYLKILRKQHNEMLYDLFHKADLAVANTNVYSVTLKTQLAPSKDPHDYMSLARYFWPNPDTKDGLPYIRRGYSNPEIWSVSDYTYLRQLMKDIQHLGFAYFFTKNDTYAKKAIYRLNEITQSISLMSSSKSWDNSVESNLKEWFIKYYEWLKTSKYGHAEHNSKNHHGTFYDIQVIYILQYLGRIEETKEFGWKALKSSVDTGILANGQQHHETSYYLLPFALNGGEGWKFKNIDGFKFNNYIRILELSWIIWGDDKYLDAIETLKPKSKLEQVLGSQEVLNENSLCVWSLMNVKSLWPCFS